MAVVPEGAQRSDDGNYYWDGNEWQAIPDDERQTDGAATPEASGDPLQDEQYRQAVSQDYPEIVAYSEGQSADLGTEPDESQEA